ncbi:MAG TPA: hypothetical protein PLA74_09195 [Syntrophales bacterium]|nr:hypothetical protein [Syntrophales bacterium]HPQ42628.1 hypothetical protein [Syntrophales bacterium]
MEPARKDRALKHAAAWDRVERETCRYLKRMSVFSAGWEECSVLADQVRVMG